MTKKINPFIYWTPRILSILFVAFLVLMSFDVFTPETTIGEELVALLMHNIPAIILAVIVWISWKKEIVGAVGFFLGGIVYMILIFRNPFEWYYLAWVIQISGVAFLVGALYLVNWLKKKK